MLQTGSNTLPDRHGHIWHTFLLNYFKQINNMHKVIVYMTKIYNLYTNKTVIDRNVAPGLSIRLEIIL